MVGNFKTARGGIFIKFTVSTIHKSAGQEQECPFCPKCRKGLLQLQLLKLIGSSSSSVTRAAIWDLSLRVKVMWANSG
jgi:hypothetical protein